MNGIVFSGVLIYIIGMLFIGYWSSKRIKNLTDFFVAGRRLPFYLAVATLFATWLGYIIIKTGNLQEISDPLFYRAAAYGGIISMLGYIMTTLVRYNKIEPIRLPSEYPEK